MQPTVFADVTPGMSIEKEEIFGPVLSMIPFDTEEEALAIANDTPYGLTNYVQTSDPARRKPAGPAAAIGDGRDELQVARGRGALWRREVIGPGARGRRLGDRGIP